LFRHRRVHKLEQENSDLRAGRPLSSPSSSSALSDQLSKAEARLLASEAEKRELRAQIARLHASPALPESDLAQLALVFALAGLSAPPQPGAQVSVTSQLPAQLAGSLDLSFSSGADDSDDESSDAEGSADDEDKGSRVRLTMQRPALPSGQGQMQTRRRGSVVVPKEGKVEGKVELVREGERRWGFKLAFEP